MSGQLNVESAEEISEAQLSPEQAKGRLSAPLQKKVAKVLTSGIGKEKESEIPIGEKKEQHDSPAETREWLTPLPKAQKKRSYYEDFDQSHIHPALRTPTRKDRPLVIDKPYQYFFPDDSDEEEKVANIRKRHPLSSNREENERPIRNSLYNSWARDLYKQNANSPTKNSDQNVEDQQTEKRQEMNDASHVVPNPVTPSKRNRQAISKSTTPKTPGRFRRFLNKGITSSRSLPEFGTSNDVELQALTLSVPQPTTPKNSKSARSYSGSPEKLSRLLGEEVITADGQLVKAPKSLQQIRSELKEAEWERRWSLLLRRKRGKSIG